MLFTGTYEHAIDPKNRIAIPSEIRELLQRDADNYHSSQPPATKQKKSAPKPVLLYITLGEQQALCLYTKKEFEQRATDLNQSQLDPQQLLEYERILYSQTTRVELDSSGRIRLPESLLRKADIGTQVVLLGVKDHLEIRNRDAWQKYIQQTLTQNPNLLMNPRRAMKPPPPPHPTT